MKQYKYINNKIKNVNTLKQCLNYNITYQDVKHKFMMLMLSSFMLGGTVKDKDIVSDQINFYKDTEQNIFNETASLSDMKNSDGIHIYGAWRNNSNNYIRNVYVYKLDNLNEDNINNFLNASSVNEMLLYLSIPTYYEETKSTMTMSEFFKEKNATLKINGIHYNMEYKEEINSLKNELFISNLMYILSLITTTYLLLITMKEYSILKGKDEIKESREKITESVYDSLYLIEKRLSELEKFGEENINDVVYKLVDDGILVENIEELPTINEIKIIIGELKEINAYNSILMKNHLYDNSSSALKEYPIERKLK